ncbi:MAG: DUF2202 domain-containing protein [Saprospiraceae bacterium]
MKKIIWLFSALVLVAFNACTQETVDETTAQSLTAFEQEDLLFLVEEEKLARDVYLYSYDRYGFYVFDHISSSEQRHMDRVAFLLNQYGIDNPTIGQAQGVFTNPTLQQLYNDLTAQSSISLLDALKVGATIEDLDISDIDRMASRTNKVDILQVQENLTCGSRNHMRAFSSKISENGGEYIPQFISTAVYESILNGPKEACGK